MGTGDKLKIFVVFAAVLFASVAVRADEGPLKQIDEISGKAFLIVESASDVARGHNLSLAEYSIKLFETDKTYVVLFVDPVGPPLNSYIFGARHGGPQPFSVTFDKASLQLIEAHFDR